jgi:hypothetical protein
MNNYANFLSSLPKKKEGKRLRFSSYDKTGGNDDRIYIKPGETRVIAKMDNPGCIEHIWMTISNEGFTIEHNALRKAVIKMYWNNEEDPSVNVPLGDFFGLGHAKTHNFVSAPLMMAPENGLGLNCFFPMPYDSAKVEVKNECQTTLILYYYIDYRSYTKKQDSDTFTFHASWNRNCPCVGKDPSSFKDRLSFNFGGENLDGKDNYDILIAKGEGHYVGTHLDIDNIAPTSEWDWPGEGDDMIFIDGDKMPTLNGTGTEDYFSMAWCPTQEFNGPYNGLILGTDKNWKGQITYYRYHILDPINFEKDIRVSIEHGHANHRSDDYSSTAYWYQKEPHMKMAELPSVEERMPLDHELSKKEQSYIKEDVKRIK